MPLNQLVLLAAAIATAIAQDFTAFNDAPLCIRSEFVETRTDAASERHCAFLCDSNGRCRGFTVSNGPCQLFVFDRCSKFVRDCSACSQRGRLFLKKKSAGLPGGLGLCPSGFGNDYCGTKYRLVGVVNGNFDQTKQSIESLPGLAIMADVSDAGELQHIHSLFSIYNREFFLLGAKQIDGSPEPAGGWLWASCQTGIIMNSSLWQTGEPNNYGAGENVVSIHRSEPKINDNSPGAPYDGALAECVSPFD